MSDPKPIEVKKLVDRHLLLLSYIAVIVTALLVLSYLEHS